MKTKIIVAGIGGVGGYFGGLLAKHFAGNEHVEIYFLARGEHLKKIRENGLTVVKGENAFVARPVLATDDPAQIGIADFIIVTTKSYDLDTIIQQLSPCIASHTVILPLLNGVDSRERIKKMLPANMVLDGCAYIVSRLKQPGEVENTGNIQTLYFGLENSDDKRLSHLEMLFREAGIEASLSGTISTILWEKFIFISPTATATSYFNNSIGEMLADKEKQDIISAMLGEIILVAKAKGVVVPDDITEKTWGRLKSMPFDATSSMHSDFKNNKPNTELESITGYVINEGKNHGIATPTYLMAYSELKRRGTN